MKCPVCKDVNLAMMDRQGIEIDYCPQCRGIWLDRGELDRLIERAEVPGGLREPGRRAPAGDELRRSDYERERERHYDDKHHHGRRRKSFLSEIFDF